MTYSFSCSKPLLNSLVNGQEASSINIQDRGLLYGDGLFETIAVLNGIPQHWKQHFDRLTKGCLKLGIPELDRDLISNEAGQLCKGIEKAVLKMIVTRGEGGRGYRPPENPVPSRILSLHEWPDYPRENTERGICLRFCETKLSENPALAGIKHLNRLEQVMARAEWSDPDIAEGLMLNGSGCVIEGTMSNLFIVQDRILLTPELSVSGVEGVMRSRILAVASDLGIVHKICQILPHDLIEADEIFISNSLINIWPVRQLDQHSYTIGNITRQLIDSI